MTKVKQHFTWLPTNKGDWTANLTVHAYDRYYYLDCEFQATEDDLTNAPGQVVTDASHPQGHVVANTGWKIVNNAKDSMLGSAYAKNKGDYAQEKGDYAQEIADSMASDIEDLQNSVQKLEELYGKNVEGYVRLSGVSDPKLEYRHYTNGIGNESVFDVFKPCLVEVGTGKLLHVLNPLNWYEDEDGNARKIDGTEGEVMVCNTKPVYGIYGPVKVGNTSYDVFLWSRVPFEWEGHPATLVQPQGMSPHYCVSHTDSDNVTRMHSVYNPSFNGSYSAMSGIIGAYEYEDGVLEEGDEGTYNENGAIFGSAGGLCSTDIDLPNGEQRAMNLNEDKTKTTPFFNSTMNAVELFVGRMIAEGGTYDAHKASLMGSGYCANDNAGQASYWAEDASDARNGMRYVNANGVWTYVSFGSQLNVGVVNNYPANFLNSWRPAWRIMEQQRVLMYAIEHNIPELTWFGYEGNKYKWRHVDGFAGPSNGVMTAVVFKHFSSKFNAGAVQPGTADSIAGNRVEFLICSAVYRGVITDVSPSWWTSGLIFTEDENGKYNAYVQREQSLLIKSVTGSIDVANKYAFEEAYHHVFEINKGSGYAKSISEHSLLLPATSSEVSGGGLHTYVGHYSYYSGDNASAGKKLVRGFRRGDVANGSPLSPLYVHAFDAPAREGAGIGFGTCVQLTDSGAAEETE
jgi:hypothetical protein